MLLPDETVSINRLLATIMAGGQSYKHFMLVNYNSTGVVTRELAILQL